VGRWRPKDVKLKASSAAITGVPKAKGTYKVRVQAEDAQGEKTKPQEVPIVINARP
jgi:hypothetical protein